MLTIVQTRYCASTEKAYLDIDQHTVDIINKDFQEHCAESSKDIKITAEMIEEAVENGSYSEDESIQVTMKYSDNSTWDVDLYDWISDYIHDWLWDLDGEVVDGEIEDSFIDIVDYSAT